MSEKSNDDQIAFWNGPSGQKWADDADRMDSMMASAAEVTLAAAAPRPGESVLDIGCGSGGTALMLADAVGPDGRVIGLDISGPMLAVARRRAEGRGNLRFIEADATTHSFTPASIDLVFSKFGVMFFADPIASFANIRKAMKPGGRLAFLCWRTMKENPFATIPIGVALRYLPPPAPADPFAPGPFAFADAERTRGILERAGFAAPKVAAFDSSMIFGDTPASAAEEGIRIGPAARLLADASEEVKRKIVADLTVEYAKLMTPRGVSVPIHCWVVTASV